MKELIEILIELAEIVEALSDIPDSTCGYHAYNVLERLKALKENEMETAREVDTPTQTLKTIIELNKDMQGILERLKLALHTEYMSLLEKEKENEAE